LQNYSSRPTSSNSDATDGSKEIFDKVDHRGDANAMAQEDNMIKTSSDDNELAGASSLPDLEKLIEDFHGVEVTIVAYFVSFLCMKKNTFLSLSLT